MEGTITRKVELRGFGFFSTFKIYFAITLIFTLISFIVVRFFGMRLVSWVAQWVGSFQRCSADLHARFPFIFENEILASLLSAIALGIAVGLVCAISAAIFSIFAALVGGVNVKIRERAPEKKTSYL